MLIVLLEKTKPILKKIDVRSYLNGILLFGQAVNGIFSDMHKWHFYVRTCINCIFLFGQSLKWHLLFGHPCSVKPCVASIFGKDKNL
jgi:hypothetical protein